MCVCVCVCVCSQCHYPEFVGDGVFCTRDTDKDGFPLVAIPTCTNATSRNPYCVPVRSAECEEKFILIAIMLITSLSSSSSSS